MSRRISIPRGQQIMFSRDINRKLAPIRRDYEGGLISKERAKERGRRVFEDEFEVFLRLSRDRVRWATNRPVTLPPERRAQLEHWRDEGIIGFEKIIDDIKRRSSK